MKKTLVLLLIAVLALALVFTCACKEKEPEQPVGPDGPDDPVGPTPTSTATIASVLADSSLKNTNVTVEGVIFAKDNGTLYINDGTGSLTVKADTANYAIGDKVKVEGKYSITATGAYPFITKVNVNITKTGTGTPISATASSVADIAAMSKTDLANFAKYVTISAKVVDSGDITLVDGENVLVCEGNSDAVKAFEGKKITLDVVITGNKADQWLVSYCGDASGIAEATVDVNTIKDQVFATITEGEVYGDVQLVYSYPQEPSVKFAWEEVGTSGVVTIDAEKHVAKVSEVTADTPFTLKLTITSGETSTSKEFNYTVKFISNAMTVSQAIEQATGTVGALKCYVANYTVSSDPVEEGRTGLVLTDGVKTLIYKTDNFARFKPNDKVLITGAEVNASATAHKLSGGTVELISSDNTIDYSGLVVDYVISDEASMTAYAKASIKEQYGLVVAFTGVYSFVGTGSSNCRWQLNYKNATASADARYAFSDYSTADKGNRTFSFSAQGNMFLVPEWWAKCDMERDGSKECKPAAGTIFAVCTAAGNTMTGWSFINPEGMTLTTVANSDAAKAVSEIDALFDIEINTQTTTKLNLATSTEHVSSIVWTSSDDCINAATGDITIPQENKEVTLVATYAIDGVNATFTKKVLVVVAEIPVLTLTEALATTGSGISIPKMSAYVAAIAGSPENADEYRDGMIITDGVNTIWYKTSAYTYGEDVKFKAGDKVLLENVTIENVAERRIMTGGTMSFVEAGTIDYTNLAVAETIDNDEKLAAFALQTANKQGYVIKITGEFSLVGCGGSDKQIRYQINFKDAAVSADARYPFPDYSAADKGNRTFCVSWKATEELFGTEMAWAPEGTKSATGKTCIKVKGTIYLVGCKNSGATMSAWTVINPSAFSLELNVEE